MALRVGAALFLYIHVYSFMISRDFAQADKPLPEDLCSDPPRPWGAWDPEATNKRDASVGHRISSFGWMCKYLIMIFSKG
jgi:hypothetical protein